MVLVQFAAEENMKPEEIREKLRLHRLWIDGKEGGVRADLSWANLRQTDLGKADLSDADLGEAIFHGANLGGADLSGAILRGATGNGREIKSAQVHTYSLVWTKDVLWIGCQCKTLDEWRRFDPSARGFREEDCAAWEAHKDWIFETVRRFPAE